MSWNDESIITVLGPNMKSFIEDAQSRGRKVTGPDVVSCLQILTRVGTLSEQYDDWADRR